MLKTLAVIAALGVILGVVAIADHTWKAEAMHRADVRWWYCANEHVRCGTDPESVEHHAGRIEHGWQERERAYTLLLGALAGAGVMTLLGRGRVRSAVANPRGASTP